MSKIIHRWIGDLREDDIIWQLLKEIEAAVKLPLSPFLKKSMVIQYLMDYRVRRPIDKNGLDTVPLPRTALLRQKLSKLKETDIYWLCWEIAQLKHISIENVPDHTLYIFLDRYLKEGKKKKKFLAPANML